MRNSGHTARTNLPDPFWDAPRHQQTHAVPFAEVAEQSQHRSRGIAAGALAVSAALGMAGAVYYLADPATLPIREIRVAGEFHHLRPDAIQRLVETAVDGGFFTVRVSAIQQRLMREPWIKQAAVQRVWPSRLQVTIIEQNPVARWGEDALLSGDGTVFRPAAAEPDAGLVRLSGPAGAEHDVLAMHRLIAREFAGLGIKVATLALSERRAWSIVTGTGQAIVLGRRDIESRIRQFASAYRSTLAADWPNITLIDMRYTNGFAVRRGGNAGAKSAVIGDAG